MITTHQNLNLVFKEKIVTKQLMLIVIFQCLKLVHFQINLNEIFTHMFKK